MPIFHKIIFKHLYVTKGKMYMHVNKEMLCCKVLIFNNCNFVCFRVFLLYISIKSTCICKSFFFLKIRVKSSFSPSSFWKERMPAVYNSTVIFLPDVSDVWRWPNPVKPLNVPFLLQNRSGTKE